MQGVLTHIETHFEHAMSLFESYVSHEQEQRKYDTKYHLERSITKLNEWIELNSMMMEEEDEL